MRALARPPAADVVAALRPILGERLSMAEADRALHARDQSTHAARQPDVVAWPESSAEVSAILRYAEGERIPVTAWGAGSSLEGNPIPLFGGIVLDFHRMNRVVALHESDFQVTVQPGLLYKDLNQRLGRSGLFFAPDPGANASIGGMIANNAAGSRTVKYGATRDNVLALQVVLASGELIRTGSRSVKQSAGYDLTHLIVGSEGTLGLVTEATLRLHPLPEHVSAVVAAFPTVAAAAETVFAIMASGLAPGALEFVDAASVRILNEAEQFGFHETPHLFMEFSGASEGALGHTLGMVEELCREAGSSDFRAGLGRDKRDHLWRGRHRLFESMVRHFAGLEWLTTDVAVPISHYPALVSAAQQIMVERELAGGLVGHAGDGNLHSIFFFPPGAQHRARAAEANDLLVARAQALEGTCTGEHGVGIGKQKYLVHEYGEAALATMRRIKQALDPNGILNPGKVLGGSAERAP